MKKLGIIGAMSVEGTDDEHADRFKGGYGLF